MLAYVQQCWELNGVTKVQAEMMVVVVGRGGERSIITYNVHSAHWRVALIVTELAGAELCCHPGACVCAAVMSGASTL